MQKVVCYRKKTVDVDRPFVVKEYNTFMGGVDKADMLLELYRIDVTTFTTG